MNPIEAGVIIATVAIIASVIKSKRQQPRDHRDYDDQEDDHRDNSDNRNNRESHAVSPKEMQLEIMALKKRVEALEAIVTDKSYSLKREIDDL
jgi:hypothetical protein